MEYKKALEIIKHVDNLSIIFNLSFSSDEEKLKFFKALHRLEIKAHRLAEQLCNDCNISEEESDKIADNIYRLLNMRLGYQEKNIPIFINYDPRGYALKIEDKWKRDNNIILYSDWGGYGIIAPSF